MKRISPHHLAIYHAVKRHKGWLTAQEIAAAAGVAPRTARLHAVLFTNERIFERRAVFPEFRYRLSRTARQDNPAYLDLLKEAEETLQG